MEIGQARHAVPLAFALADGGLTCLEITFRTAAAAEAITAVATEAPDVLVGAGTVRTVEQADMAVAAGARFLVAPGLSPAVVARAQHTASRCCPACVLRPRSSRPPGWDCGLLKFFPAEAAGGLAYLKALGGPFQDMRFVPTGGIGPGNLAAYLELPLRRRLRRQLDDTAAAGGGW